MMEPNPPRVTTLSLRADGSEILATWTLRAWVLIDAETRGSIVIGENGLERRNDCVALRIPIHPLKSEEWSQTQHALTLFRRMVDALRFVDVLNLGEHQSGQLVYIDALVLQPGISDISVLASPAFAAFIRLAPDDVFDRVSAAMIRAEETTSGPDVYPSARGASRCYGVLHLWVGDDCATVGVASVDLPCDAGAG
ncbi:MAG: hypothetical protein AAB473_02580 [Patescibacteria group bacterium]